MDTTGTALVLGAGGPVGTAWLLGLAAGLRDGGADPDAADLIVGTSAGAIAGAAIRSGRDLAELAGVPARPSRPTSTGPTMARVFELLNDPAVDHPERLRRVGRLALAADALDPEEHVANMRALLGTDAWPAKRLLVTTVDAERGEPRVWDGGAPLSRAVAASSAAPGYARPVPIDGRPYLDGAFGGGAYPHLAAGAATVVVVEPIARMASAGSLVPDERGRAAFGDDLGDRSRWAPVFAEGRRQGRTEAAATFATWPR
ncbi:patatin-like phospholipase family protein [Actinomadura parmotrematis]|uniref:Patatin-like phospholipase family protein n=1 Tax=Actinomadura parmotrematis TaxID=2864039 RepID=A0ABS7FRI6_9ACTN|nr:patatin-like phospholipase family protein [Actinomadura parmotrematis]MBW8483021.1 patatin-like phospholipase family protein [Actinomadura parmotrematis]